MQYRQRQLVDERRDEREQRFTSDGDRVSQISDEEVEVLLETLGA